MVRKMPKHTKPQGVGVSAFAGYMLQLGQGIRKLTVDSLSLQSDTHANTPWPWDQLDVGTGDDMTQLLRLPTPVSRGEPPTITCFPLTISADTKVRWHTLPSHVRHIHTHTHTHTHSHTHTHTHAHAQGRKVCVRFPSSCILCWHSSPSFRTAPSCGWIQAVFSYTWMM